MSKPSIDIGQFSQEERLELIEELWESLGEEEREALPLTGEQQDELDRRLDSLEKEGPVGLQPEEVRARLRRPAS
ncbi:MAG: addiction module protein [Acidobacteria bacterium]|nr:addiction module protein [Acidobacteriota bacterium]